MKDPADIERFYRAGLFDAVVVGIFNQRQREQVEYLLYGKGIPVVSLIRSPVFKPLEFFEQAPSELSLKWSGYSLCEFEGMRLEVQPHSGYPFIYDKNGNVNSAYWLDYHFLQEPFARLFRPSENAVEVELAGQWCVLAKVYAKNYWHFTFEVLDQVWMLEKSGYQGNYILNKPSFAPELLTLLGIDLKRVFWLEDFDEGTAYRIERLVCTVLNKNNGAHSARVLTEMAPDIVRNLPPSDISYPERVYVKRIGTRKLNVSEEMLRQYGFVTIIPEELSVAEQISYFHNARVVLSPHGANTTNSLYMKPGSVLIETFPNEYTIYFFLHTLRLQGVHYIPLAESKLDAEGHPGGMFADYSIDPRLLEMAIKSAIQLAGTTNC